MKFLCLHGAGTSAEKFNSVGGIYFNASKKEKQLTHKGKKAPVLTALKAHADFEYYDGFLEVDTVEEIKKVFRGPFFTWYSPGLGGQTLVEAKAELLHLIEAEGPFDACLGFSQGAALLAAIMIDYQKNYPFRPNLFRLAVFICATAPVLVTKSAAEQQQDATETYRPSIDCMEPLTEPWEGPYVPGHEPQPYEEWKIFVAERVCAAGLAIRIPTAHIYGSKDNAVSESLRLRDMCVSRRRVEFDHGCGHEVPRAPQLVSQMAETINRVVKYALTAI